MFAGETIWNTIRGEAHMARGTAMITDICRRHGDGVRAHAVTHANRIQNLRRTRDLPLPRLLSGQVEPKIEEVQA